MATTKTRTEGSEALKQVTYLASALKAPRITEAAGRLADHARDAGWTHEEYLAAVLDREVAARNASGAQLRIRAAGFGARTTIEEFDWDAQPAVRQQMSVRRRTIRPRPASMISAGKSTRAFGNPCAPISTVSPNSPCSLMATCSTPCPTNSLPRTPCTCGFIPVWCSMTRR